MNAVYKPFHYVKNWNCSQHILKISRANSCMNIEYMIAFNILCINDTKLRPENTWQFEYVDVYVWLLFMSVHSMMYPYISWCSLNLNFICTWGKIVCLAKQVNEKSNLNLRSLDGLSHNRNGEISYQLLIAHYAIFPTAWNP